MIIQHVLTVAYIEDWLDSLSKNEKDEQSFTIIATKGIGSAILSGMILNHNQKTFGPLDRFILLIIANHLIVDFTNELYSRVSYAQLARQSGLSVANLKEHINFLIARGYLFIRPSSKIPNEYQINLMALSNAVNDVSNNVIALNSKELKFTKFIN